MTYWGGRSEDSDFAFDSVGATMFLIRERLLKEIEIVRSKDYPEQSIVALLTCLRLLGERFPKNLSVVLHRRDLALARDAFESWVVAAGHRVPAEHMDQLRTEADSELRLLEACMRGH